MERLGERLGEELLLCQGCSEEPSSPKVSGRQLLAAGYMPDPSRVVISEMAEETLLPAAQGCSRVAVGSKTVVYGRAFKRQNIILLNS